MLSRNATLSVLAESGQRRASQRRGHDLAAENDEQQQRGDRRAGRNDVAAREADGLASRSTQTCDPLLLPPRIYEPEEVNFVLTVNADQLAPALCQTLRRRGAPPRATASSGSSSLVSSSSASGAGFSGATARPKSRSSRERMSASTSSIMRGHAALRPAP